MKLSFQSSPSQWDTLPPLIRASIERMDSTKNAAPLIDYLKDLKRCSRNIKRSLTCVMLDIVSHEINQKNNDAYKEQLKNVFMAWFALESDERIWIQRDSMINKNHPGLRWINFYSCMNLLKDRMQTEKLYDEWSPILTNLWSRIHIEIEQNATNNNLSCAEMWNAISMSITDKSNDSKHFHNRIHKDMLMFLGQYNDLETPSDVSKALGDEFSHMIMYSCKTLGIPDAVSVAAGIYGSNITLEHISQIVTQYLRSVKEPKEVLDSSSLDIDFDY